MSAVLPNNIPQRPLMTVRRLTLLCVIFITATTPGSGQQTLPQTNRQTWQTAADLQPAPNATQLRPAPQTRAASVPAPQENHDLLMQRIRQLAEQPEPPRSAAARPALTKAATTAPSMPAAQVATTTIAKVGFQTESTVESAAATAAKTSSEPVFLDLTQPPEDPQIAAATNSSDSDLMIRFAIWTVIIICCCGLTALGVRYWQRRKGILPAINSQSRVLETVALGGHRTISLIQLRDVRAVVGCDGTGVCSIVIAPESFDQRLAETEESYEAA